MNSLSRVRSTCTLIAALAAVACSRPDQDLGQSSAGNGAPGVDWPTFREQFVSAGPNGTYLVEGDMLFLTEEQVYNYWLEAAAPRPGGELTVNRVTVNGVTVDDLWLFPANFNLTYCVGSGFTAAQKSQLLPALDAAAQAWSNIVGIRHLRVTPAGACTSSNTGVVFDVQRNTDGTFFGLSFFPSYARSSRTLYLDDSAFTTTAGGRTLTGIITHEFGHTMGWRHEHIWTNPTTGCTAESSANARLVTSQVDQSSVMYYPQCRTPAGGGYHITNLDYSGGVQLYGLAPALITTVGGVML